MANEALVSVCINCYNAEATIAHTLTSVLQQTYRRLQVIVVDDGSVDRTREILSGFDDERLTLCFLEQNGHIANANNEALSRCEGEYIAHLDADDAWFPDKLEKQVAFLEAHPEYGAVFAVSEAVDENGQPVEDDRYRAVNKPQAAMLRTLLTDGNFLNHSSMLARKAVIEQVGLHDVSLVYLHDFDYWVRMCLVCPIYVLEEPLLQYRIAASSNSNREMTRERFGAHMIENARIHDRAIRQCPDALFSEAFADRLRRPDLPLTHERTEIEKAFVLLTTLTHLPQNPALGLGRLAELMNIPRYRAMLAEEYDLTARQFYALQEAVVLHNEAEATHYRNLVEIGKADYAALQAQQEEEKAKLRASLDASREHERQLEDNRLCQEAALTQAHNELAQIRSSRWWRLGAPLRRWQRRRRIDRTAKQPRLKDGTPAKAVAVLYGFFGHNLGDDLFFDRLLKRYPDTVFAVFDAEHYEDFFAAYPNVYSYTRREAAVASIGERFEELLLSKADAVVHIGGSIYQQVGDWETDMRVREKRYVRSRPFFSVSSNFGPYHTEAYRAFWEKQFEKAGDICFRDTYSASVFPQVDTVRYAPDLLFSQPLPAVRREENRLFVSVIDPSSPQRAFSEEQSTHYYRLLTETVTRWLEDGGTVNLAAFCPYEGDMQAVQTVKNGIPEALRERVIETIYTSTAEAIHGVLDALCRSSHVLATRFHAMVFGLTSGAAVVPICYSDKMDHVLEDIGFDGTVLSMKTITAVSTEELLEALRTQRPFETADVQTAASAQFEKLDAFLRQKGAAVKEETV